MEKLKPVKPEEAVPPAKQKPEEAKPAKPAKAKPEETVAPKEEKPAPQEEKPAPTTGARPEYQDYVIAVSRVGCALRTLSRLASGFNPHRRDACATNSRNSSKQMLG